VVVIEPLVLLLFYLGMLIVMEAVEVVLVFDTLLHLVVTWVVMLEKLLLALHHLIAS